MDNKELKKIKALTWYSYDDIVSKAKEDLDRGDSAMANIRLELNSEMKMYRSQKKNSKKEKVGDWTVYSTHSALMALSYINRPECEFTTDSVSIPQINKVNNLNSSYKDDFSKDDMEILKYWQDFWLFMSGISITARTGWDGTKKRNRFSHIDTRYWIPDPDGDYVSGEYSYNGFYRNLYESSLRSQGLWDDNLSAQNKNEIVFDPEKEDKVSGWMLDQWDAIWEGANQKYRIDYYFGYINPKNKKGKPIKIMAVLWNSRELLLDVKVIDFFPFAFKYWSPDGSITGMRVGKITGDVQKVKAEIANLRLDKSKSELYPMWLRNKRIIPDTSDLTFGLNKVIDAIPLEGQSVKDGLVPIQKDYRVDQSFIIDNSLDRSVQDATAVNAVVKGNTPERREAVGVVDQAMESSDTIMAFRAKIESWGEKQMMRIYIQGIRMDMKSGDKKSIKALGWYGTITKTITIKDLDLSDDVDIKITTAIEKKKNQQELQVAYGQAIGMAAALGLSESAQRFMYRDYFESIGLPPEKAERIVDYTPDEIEAIANVSLLNQGVYIEVKQYYDPMTHLSAIKSAKPWINTDLYRRWLLALYKAKWQPSQMVQWGGNQDAIKNNMAAQASAWLSNQASQIINNQ